MGSARRIVVADRSPTVRTLLRRLLAASGLDIVGEAGSVEELLPATERLRPDALVLDAELPGGEGLARVLGAMAGRSLPVLMICSRRSAPAAKAFESLQGGAVAVFAKPETPEAWHELARALADDLRHLEPQPDPGRSARPVEVERRHRLRWVAIGASTGGPQALRALLPELLGAPVGIAVVQHIAAGFEDGLALWLGRETGLDVRPAVDGELLVPGAVRLSRPGTHLALDGSGALRLDGSTPPYRGHRPSVDRLFESCRALDPRRLAAVLLSGMGDDGAKGMAALRAAGALALVQDRSTCSVFGMPAAALALAAADLELAPTAIGRTLARLAREQG